jgi:hypothetical protein
LPKRESAPPSVKAQTAPQVVASAPTINVQELVASLPQANKTLLQISASNPQAIEFAGSQIRKHLDVLFGKNGFMGIGSEEGIASPHWNDPSIGFAKRTVEEILGKDSFPLTDDKKYFGLEDKSATEKMQEYLMFTLDETGVYPESGEKAEDYLKRAAAITIDKYIDKKELQVPALINVEKTVAGNIILPPKTPEPTHATSKPEPEVVTIPSTAPAKVALVQTIKEDLHPIIEEPTMVPPVIDGEKEIDRINSQNAPAETAPVITPYSPVLRGAAPAASIMDTMVSASQAAAETPVASRPTPDAPTEPAPSIFATMPQQFLPNNPQVIAYADVEVEKHLDILFGAKGVFGLGAKRGIDSADWKDPVNGFSNKTVAAIMEAEPEIYPAPGTPNIGIKSHLATTKVQDYIMLAMSETGVHPEPEEKAEDYLKRAAAITIDKFIQKEGKAPQI